MEPWRVCRNYSRARRHPFVLGRIGDIRIPGAYWWQVAAAVGSVAVLYATRGAWFRLPVPFRVALLIGPLAAAWAAGKVDRNPFATAAAAVAHAAGRYGGWGEGRFTNRARPVRVRVPVVDVAEETP